MWNPNVHNRAYNSPPPVSFLTQTNTLYVPTSFCVLKTNFNIIVPSMPLYSKWLLSLPYHHQNPVFLSPNPKSSKCPYISHPLSFNQMHDNWSTVHIMKLFDTRFPARHPKWLQLADTHTEYNQLQLVHVQSCTCRCTALCYTVLPLYTRRLILRRKAELVLYASKIIHYNG